mmetsp:Transcript_22837/g.38179  ORF Transcript_22837/g.38179 Transcript_22837/m.38179 type:complete len:182 (+) Transcript_22837:367-912(+)
MGLSRFASLGFKTGMMGWLCIMASAARSLQMGEAVDLNELSDVVRFQDLVIKSEEVWLLGIFSSTYTNDDVFEKHLYPKMADILKDEMMVSSLDYHDIPEVAKELKVGRTDLPALLLFRALNSPPVRLDFPMDPDGTLHPANMARLIREQYLKTNKFDATVRRLFLKREPTYWEQRWQEDL